MAQNTSKAIILKVLSGMQYGVEIGLSDGEYTFGSGPEADIQFTDLSMADVHGALRIGSGKIEIKTLSGAVKTGSGLVIEAGDDVWHEIAQLDQVAAGMSSFAIGAQDARWSLLAPVQDTPAQSSSRASYQGWRGRLVPFLAVAGIVGTCIFGALYFVDESKRLNIDADERAAPVDDLASINAALKDLPFTHSLSARKEADGVVFVTGYVDNAPQRRAAQNALRETGATVRPRIWALDAMRGDIDGLLDSQDVNLSYTLSPDGVLTLSGNNLDSGAVLRTVELLEGAVFGLAGVNNEVRTAQTYLDMTYELIDRVQLNELVIARLVDGRIETTGVVPSEKTDNWAGFIRSYSRQVAPYLPLRSFVTLEGLPESTEPIILSGTPIQTTGEVGRRLPIEDVTSDAVRPDQLFASEFIAEPPAPEVTPVDTQTADLIDNFTRSNPELTTQLIRTLTDGAVGSINELRTLITTANQPVQDQNAKAAAQPERPASNLQPAPAPAPVSALTQILSLSEPAGVSEPANASEPADRAAPAAPVAPVAPSSLSLPAQGQENANTSAPASNGSENAAESAVVVQDIPKDGLSSLVLANQREAAPNESLTQLNSVIDQIYSDEAGTTILNPQISQSQPELAQVSIDLVRLANEQRQALISGDTLLSAPQPALSAFPQQTENADACWPGSYITAQNLPSVLVWMDIISLDASIDVSSVDPYISLFMLEAGLNPNKLIACLNNGNTEFGQRVLQESAFLQESQANQNFAQYIFRFVPGFDLDLQGVNTLDQPYVQLTDGRKLGEGSAPTAQSRLISIGEKGLIVRVLDGYRVVLYPQTLSWHVAES